MNTIKINLLKDAFEKRFDIDRFKKFVRDFFNEPEMLIGTKSIAIWREYTDYVNSYYKIANYTDNEDNRLIVLAVELKRGGSIDRARSMQRNFISKVLDENNLEAAIVAFFNQEEPSWRLSFVRLDYAFTDKGLDLDLTPARRYSYLVGENEPNHTALAQLLPIFEDDEHNPTLDKIENSFSVEKVTKDFFAQYKEKYYELKEFLEQDEPFIKEARKLGIEENKFAEQFAKKLMGQLAFLYFIQKKGWLGVKIVPKTILKSDLATIYSAVEERQKKILQDVYRGIDKNTYELKIDYISSDDFSEKDAEILSDIFSGNEKFDEPWGNGYKQFIREVLWKHCMKYNKNFFMDYLEPFFYDALNKSRKNYYFKTFNCKLPFLNAGLFEPLEGYDWSNISFRIPNHIFSNEDEKGREADGILDVFDRYNFTMNEDEPLEKEVAIDPEMLGKIFENLLEASDRKSKGAFYTPREIVHYMCQESLINYLTNEVDISYEDLKEFILYGELIKDADNRRDVGYGKDFTIKQSIFDNILKIDRALENVRIADPAVGSGAFPLGMLNEIIKARNNITEYVIKIDRVGKLGEKYGEKHIRSRRSIYNMKLKTIKNSIFAVDIEPSAIDITKLRLWLSIVIEQEIDELNPEPHPLPNLDVNIHVGNSLIDEYEGIKLFDESILFKKNDFAGKGKEDGEQEQLRLFFGSDEILKEMYEKQSQYFDEYNEDKKKSLKLRIEELRDQLIIQRLKEMGKSDKIADYNAIRNKRIRPYFIWELEFAKVFQEKGGFDIVIGNPPYVKEYTDSSVFSNLKKNKYYQGKMDLWYFFACIGIDLLKENGILSFISPNNWTSNFGASKMRDKVLKETEILAFLDFGDYMVFNTASIQTMVFLLKKIKPKDYYRILFKKIQSPIEKNIINKFLANDNAESFITKSIEFKPRANIGQFILFADTQLSYVLEKIELNRHINLLKSEIAQGIIVPQENLNKKNAKILGDSYIEGEGIFVLTHAEKEKLNLKQNELAYLKPLFTSNQIKGYKVDSNNNNWIIYTRSNINNSIYKLPNIKNHLSKYEKIITSDNRPYGLHRARNKEFFIGERIIATRKCLKPTFSYIDFEGYFLQTFNIIKTNKIDTKYLLAILNSRLVAFWLLKKGKMQGSNYQLDKEPLINIPIVLPTIETQKQIIDCITTLLDNHDGIIEEKMNDLVFDIYNLEENDIQYINSHF